MILLNGWQRLWILVSAVYLLAVIAIVSWTLPSETDVEVAESLAQVSTIEFSSVTVTPGAR